MMSLLQIKNTYHDRHKIRSFIYLELQRSLVLVYVRLVVDLLFHERCQLLTMPKKSSATRTVVRTRLTAATNCRVLFYYTIITVKRNRNVFPNSPPKFLWVFVAERRLALYRKSVYSESRKQEQKISLIFECRQRYNASMFGANSNKRHSNYVDTITGRIQLSMLVVSWTTTLLWTSNKGTKTTERRARTNRLNCRQFVNGERCVFD